MANRVLFILYTCKKNIKKTSACLKTSLRNKTNFVVVTDEQKKAKNYIFNDVSGYNKLTKKSLIMWQQIYKKYKRKYDYFVKFDDDTFIDVIAIENHLIKVGHKKCYLGNKSHWSRINKKKEIWPAGSLYILGNKALEKLVQAPLEINKISDSFGSKEDVAIAHLLQQKSIVCKDLPNHLLSYPFDRLDKIPPNIFSISQLSPLRMFLLSLIWKPSQSLFKRSFAKIISHIVILKKILIVE